MTPEEEAHMQELEGLVKRYRSRIVALKEALIDCMGWIDPEEDGLANPEDARATLQRAAAALDGDKVGRSEGA